MQATKTLVNEAEVVRLSAKLSTAINSYYYLTEPGEMVKESRLRGAWKVVMNRRSALMLALCSLEGELSIDTEITLADLGVIA